ncbi:MAG: hypothetical protein OHK0046_20240 [Anaerolineae bacterium]
MPGMTRPNPLLLYALLVLLAALGVFASTANHGLGFSPDSFAYLRGADLVFSDPLTPSEDLSKFPPLYAAVLALLESNLTVIRWFNAAVLTLNLGLFAVAMQFTGVRWRVGLPVLAALALAPELVFRHSMVMSEPLFLLLIQITLLLLVHERYGWALLPAALLPMQRYAGVAFIAACVLYIWGHLGWRRGWRRALLFGGLALLPVVGWLVRGSLVADNPRQILWHPVSLDHLRDAVLTLGGRYWFAPAAVVALGLATINRAHLRALHLPRTVQAALLFIACYVGFLLVSISFYDFYTPLDSRILSPVLLLGWLVMAWFVDAQFALLKVGRRWWGLAFGVVLLGFGLFGAVRMAENNQEGVGLAQWIEDDYYPVLAALPENVIYYSNHTVVIDVMILNDPALEHTRANSLPAKYDPITLVENPDYESEYQQLMTRVEEGRAIIIWFDEVERDNVTSLAELEGLPVQDYNGLRIFGLVDAIAGALWHNVRTVSAFISHQGQVYEQRQEKTHSHRGSPHRKAASGALCGHAGEPGQASA